jgi:hypothetical protein
VAGNINSFIPLKLTTVTQIKIPKNSTLKSVGITRFLEFVRTLKKLLKSIFVYWH